MKQLSLLIGAGFSVNKGYPSANLLNEKITTLTEDMFCIATQGSFCFLKKGDEDPYNYSQYYTYKLFSLDLIKLYANREQFDYEKFYDFYKALNKKGAEDDEFNALCENYRKKWGLEIDNHNLISQHDKIFNQMISAFLVDEDGNKFYKPISHTGNYYQGYTGFLNCIQHWKKDMAINIHTLNHDLFFESLNNTSWLKGELSDGFAENGSPYYGEIEDGVKVRLSFFNKEYPTNLRFYKLHGSLDQYPFHLKETGVDNYIKIKYGVGITDLYKEISDEVTGRPKYVNDFVNYYPDFLSGTTSKILRYREPVYYNHIFQQFEENLRNSEILVLIGYGCRDEEINKIIKENFRNKMIFVIDPYPHDDLRKFVESFGALLIEKTPDNIAIEDFQKS